MAEVDEAFSPMAVTIRINDEIDISRGDMIVRPNNQPTVAQDIDAMVCWMNERISLRPGSKLVIKHTTRSTKVIVRDLSYLLDINTLHRDESAAAVVAQRDRAGAASQPGAAVLRRVPAEPSDRQLRPDRRGHKRDSGVRG